MTTRHKRDAEKLGEDISFGLQQTLACWATDFIDPYIGKWFQDQYKDTHHNSSLKHTWAGEIVGDSAAFFVFLGVQRFLPEPMNWYTRSVKTCLNPFYDWMGKESLKAWALHHGFDEESETYRRKLEDWKGFQASNFARSSVISISSVVADVATQKTMGNTHKLSVITASKVIGAAITMAAMLGLRLAIPKSTRQLDEELSDRYFAPLIRKTQKLVGAKVDDEHSLHMNDYPDTIVEEEALPQQEHTQRHVHKIRGETKSQDEVAIRK